MKTEKAKEIAGKVEQLTLVEKRLKLFKQTKEFCDIKLHGEDGNESEYYFNMNWKQHREEIKRIRTLIEEMLLDKINSLTTEIEKL